MLRNIPPALWRTHPVAGVRPVPVSTVCRFPRRRAPGVPLMPHSPCSVIRRLLQRWRTRTRATQPALRQCRIYIYVSHIIMYICKFFLLFSAGIFCFGNSLLQGIFTLSHITPKHTYQSLSLHTGAQFCDSGRRRRRGRITARSHDNRARGGLPRPCSSDGIFSPCTAVGPRLQRCSRYASRRGAHRCAPGPLCDGRARAAQPHCHRVAHGDQRRNCRQFVVGAGAGASTVCNAAAP
jgi:hypothetical protein